MTWTIWCMGDIDYFVKTLNGVAMLFNSDIFDQLLAVHVHKLVFDMVYYQLSW